MTLRITKKTCINQCVLHQKFESDTSRVQIIIGIAGGKLLGIYEFTQILTYQIMD
jgi:hypothetical protein